MGATYKFEKCTVRVHDGKRTEEERKEALGDAMEKLFKDVEKRYPGYWHRLIADRQ